MKIRRLNEGIYDTVENRIELNLSRDGFPDWEKLDYGLRKEFSNSGIDVRLNPSTYYKSPYFVILEIGGLPYGETIKKALRYNKEDGCLYVVDADGLSVGNRKFGTISDLAKWIDEEFLDDTLSDPYDESIRVRKSNFPLKERKDNDIEQRHISSGELKRIFKGYKFD